MSHFHEAVPDAFPRIGNIVTVPILKTAENSKNKPFYFHSQVTLFFYSNVIHYLSSFVRKVNTLIYHLSINSVFFDVLQDSFKN